MVNNVYNSRECAYQDPGVSHVVLRMQNLEIALLEWTRTPQMDRAEDAELLHRIPQEQGSTEGFL
jgi:hypothetical protein